MSKSKLDMHLVIRVDGGSEIGYGHLIRSNALAEEVLRCGHKVTVATTTPQPTQSVFSDSAGIVELSSRTEPEPFIQWLRTKSPDAVFTDSYLVDTGYQRAVRDQAPLAVLQDDARHAVCADLFVNGNLYASDLNYNFVGRKPQTLLGTDYILLRSSIRNRAKDSPHWREKPEHALVTMGGSDTANITPTVISAFDGFDIQVDAIVGPGFSRAQEDSICAAANKISTKVSVTRDPADLAERMFQADFAVSTASSTTYELLALGTPLISVPVVDNQDPIARELHDRNAARVLARSSNTTDFEAAIKMYMTDPVLRQKRREIGRKLVDGRGTQRICSELLSVAEGNYEYDR